MNGEGEQTLRQRKQAATALNIEKNAVALVARHGFDRVTVDMICEASGVSQRTFFNYFKTKDAAILGGDSPKLDEGQVREFLASDSPDLLGELMALLIKLVPLDTENLPLAAARLRVIGDTPALLQKEMERLFAVREEMAHILYLRMRRTASPTESRDETREQAAIVSHVVAGLLRYTVERWGSQPPASGVPDLDQITNRLAAVLAKLGRR